MRAGAITRAELQRREGHNRLIRHRRRAKRYGSHTNESLDGRMVGGDCRRVKMRRARLYITLDTTTNLLQQLHILVALIHPHIYHKTALGGNYVMLRAGIDARNGHLNGAEQW